MSEKHSCRASFNLPNAQLSRISLNFNLKTAVLTKKSALFLIPLVLNFAKWVQTDLF